MSRHSGADEGADACSDAGCATVVADGCTNQSAGDGACNCVVHLGGRMVRRNDATSEQGTSQHEDERSDTFAHDDLQISEGTDLSRRKNFQL